MERLEGHHGCGSVDERELTLRSPPRSTHSRRQRVLLAFSGLSMLLCAGLCLLWSLSYLSQQYLFSQTHKDGVYLVYSVCTSTRGGITIRGTAWDHLSDNPRPPPRARNVLGFEFTRASWEDADARHDHAGTRTDAGSLPYRYIRVPYWPVIFVTGGLGVYWCRYRIRRLRERYAPRRQPCRGFDVMLTRTDSGTEGMDKTGKGDIQN